jgi:hypothetical protein
LITSQTGRRWAASSGVTGLPVVLSVALILITTPRVQAAEPASSNLDLMTELCTQIVEDIVGKIGPDMGGKTRLQVVPFGNSEDYGLLEDIFTRILDEKGMTAVLPSAQSPEDGNDNSYVLKYKVPVFRLIYTDVYRSHLIGGKKVRRDANVRVSAKLHSGTGEVVWIGDSQADRSDQFSQSDIGRIQEGSYQFVKPEMPGSGWGKIVEPVFVSAIIVGMIYLFFSNQSDS